MQDALRIRPNLRYHGIWLPTRFLNYISYSCGKVWIISKYLTVSVKCEMYLGPCPASDREESGRGEGRSSSSCYRSTGSSLNTDYMNRHMQDRLPRPPTNTTSWPSSLSQSRTNTQKTYLSRAVTEVRHDCLLKTLPFMGKFRHLGAFYIFMMNRDFC